MKNKMTKKEEKMVKEYIKAAKKATKALREFNKIDSTIGELGNDETWSMYKRLQFDEMATDAMKAFIEELLNTRLALKLDIMENFNIVTLEEIVETYLKIKLMFKHE